MVLTNANVITWLEAYILKENMMASYAPLYEYTVEIEAKMQERLNYYNQVHPDRAVYIQNMDRLDNELKVLVASRDAAREINRKKLESISYQMALKTATTTAAMNAVATKLKFITITPTV